MDCCHGSRVLYTRGRVCKSDQARSRRHCTGAAAELGCLSICGDPPRHRYHGLVGTYCYEGSGNLPHDLCTPSYSACWTALGTGKRRRYQCMACGFTSCRRCRRSRSWSSRCGRWGRFRYFCPVHCCSRWIRWGCRSKCEPSLADDTHSIGKPTEHRPLAAVRMQLGKGCKGRRRQGCVRIGLVVAVGVRGRESVVTRTVVIALGW